MIKRTAAAAAATLLALTAVSTSAAVAAPSPHTVASSLPGARADVVCTVNDNGVNYRSGPGSQYPVMGTVDKGQKLNAHGREGSWVMGDLWGGTTGVWIHIAYLDC